MRTNVFITDINGCQRLYRTQPGRFKKGHGDREGSQRPKKKTPYCHDVVIRNMNTWVFRIIEFSWYSVSCVRRKHISKVSFSRKSNCVRVLGINMAVNVNLIIAPTCHAEQTYSRTWFDNFCGIAWVRSRNTPCVQLEDNTLARRTILLKVRKKLN